MNKEKLRARPWLVLSALSFACALLAIAGLLGPLPAARAGLPPRPTPVTPTGTPTPRPQEPAGAWIALRVHHPGRDPSFSWQELWTTVQWQDSSGRWHDVEGWRGTLDMVADGAGTKVWWVAQVDFGTGPFRWVIRQQPRGEALAESEPFTLPEDVGQILEIHVALAR